MRQLSGVDASFLHLEDGRLTGHVGGLIVVDPSTADHPINVETIKAHVAPRIAVLPPLRWKLAEVPLGIDLPYWYDDHDVDLDFHIRGIGLPAPGSREQLIDQISRIHARPLDRVGGRDRAPVGRRNRQPPRPTIRPSRIRSRTRHRLPRLRQPLHRQPRRYRPRRRSGSRTPALPSTSAPD